MVEYPINPIRDTSYELADPSKDWSESYFENQYESTKKLGRIDIQSKEGLEELVNLVGDERVLTVDQQTREGLLYNVQNAANDSLYSFTTANAKNLAESLDPRVAVNYLIQSPSFEKEGDEKYNEINKAKEKLAYMDQVSQSEEAQREYATKLFEGCSDFTKAIWAPYVGAIIQGEARIAQEKLMNGLQDYGIENFIEANISTAQGLEKELQEVQKEKNETFREKLIEATETKGSQLSAYEAAEIRDKYARLTEEEIKKYQANIGASQALPQIVEKLQDTVYQSIKAKQQAEEKKKQDEKKAKEEELRLAA